MADDQIYNFISDYLDGSITREQFWVLAKFKYPTHQIAFCSEAALKSMITTLAFTMTTRKTFSSHIKQEALKNDTKYF